MIPDKRDRRQLERGQLASGSPGIAKLRRIIDALRKKEAAAKKKLAEFETRISALENP